MLLDAADLRFSYPKRSTPGEVRAVIDGVSVSIAAGARVGILGPNGSGKTTLIKLLSGALEPSAGMVRLDGRPLAALPRRDRARRIAVVPQDTQLAFDYTALEIVLMGRYPRLSAFEIEGPADLQAAFTALETTGTRDLAERPFPTLSGGERQRVVIAAALAQLDDRHENGPRDAILFLDEPTASLDLHYQLELASLLSRVAALGTTIVLSTHDLRLAAAVCTTVLLLADGRLLAAGSPESVMTAPLIADLYRVPTELVRPLLVS